MDGQQVMRPSDADFTVNTEQYLSPISAAPDMTYWIQTHNDVITTSCFNNCFPYPTSLPPLPLQNAPSSLYFDPSSNPDLSWDVSPSLDDSFDHNTTPDSGFSACLDAISSSSNYIFTDSHESQPDNLTLPQAVEYSITSSITEDLLKPSNYSLGSNNNPIFPNLHDPQLLPQTLPEATDSVTSSITEDLLKPSDYSLGSNNNPIFADLHNPQLLPPTLPEAADSVTSSFTWDILEPKQDQESWALPCSSLDSSYLAEQDGQDLVDNQACLVNTQRCSTPNQGIEEGQSKPQRHKQATHPGTQTSLESKVLNNENMSLKPRLSKLCFMDSFRYPCSYSGCNKTFKRKEHARRHYTTKHQDAQELECEFCGKNTFNRVDNLNAHRKLHAERRLRLNNGVHYVPAAAQILGKIPRPGRPRKYTRTEARRSADVEA